MGPQNDYGGLTLTLRQPGCYYCSAERCDQLQIWLKDLLAAKTYVLAARAKKGVGRPGKIIEVFQVLPQVRGFPAVSDFFETSGRRGEEFSELYEK